MVAPIAAFRMKTVGILGGIGPESTVEYYRGMIAAYRERRRDGSYPPILINSIDLKRAVDLVEAKDYEGLSEYLAGGIRMLARAGAELALMAANTPHIVFEAVRRRSPIPLISIVEAARDAARALGLRRPGLFGTRFTMQGGFYQEIFAGAGMTIVVPSEEEQAFIHEKYMNELVKGVFLPETRERLTAIAGDLEARAGIDGLILGGTELPLILRDPTIRGIPVLDTTRIHVHAAMEQLLTEERSQ
jgi:aspartate racemase